VGDKYYRSVSGQKTKKSRSWGTYSAGGDRRWRETSIVLLRVTEGGWSEGAPRVKEKATPCLLFERGRKSVERNEPERKKPFPELSLEV